MEKCEKYTNEFVDKVVAYFNEHESTVRGTAEVFDVSKTTVHNYLTVRRPNPISADILKKNKRERHIRGGEATKRKYTKMRSS